MERLVCKAPMMRVPEGRALTAEGRLRAVLTAEQKCFVYAMQIDAYEGDPQLLHDDEGETFLVGVFEGRCELDLTLPGFFAVKCQSEGKVWMHLPVARQSVTLENVEKYTTLDKPPPMSPEMIAISRLVKQNQLDREDAMRRERALLAKIGTQEAAHVVEDEDDAGEEDEDERTAAKPEKGDKPGGGEADADGQGGDDDADAPAGKAPAKGKAKSG